MDFDLNEIIRIKIKYDNSIYFRIDELEYFCNIINIDINELTKILNLKPSKRNENIFLSKVYQVKKEEYFINNHETLINKLIEENIKHFSTISFSLEQITNLEKSLNINAKDIVKFILKSNKYEFLLRGDYKSFVSNYYKQIKQEYLKEKSKKIILNIIKLKIPSDYTKKFDYIEIKKISEELEINIKDFIVNILGIKEYSKRQVSEENTFSSELYKNEKEKYLIESKKQILTDIMFKRVFQTASYSFNRKTIIELSNYYQMNIRDFIVFILGKSDQLYHDFKSERIQSINSNDYLEVKKEYIFKKKESIKDIFSPYKRTYFTLEDIYIISKQLNINSDDIILYFFEKTKKNLYNLNNSYRNRKRISFGEYKSGKIPNDYIEKNYEYLRKNIVVAVKSVFNFLGIKNYEGNNIFEDLVQEGIIYIMEYGNPYSDEGYMIGESDIQYQQEHSKIIYTKCYYFILTRIKQFIHYKEKNGEYCDTTLKKEYLDDDFDSIEQINFIENITEDIILQKILIFFSQNLFSDATIDQLSLNLNLNKEEILQYLCDVKNLIESGEISINSDNKKL